MGVTNVSNLNRIIEDAYWPALEAAEIDMATSFSMRLFGPRDPLVIAQTVAGVKEKYMVMRRERDWNAIGPMTMPNRHQYNEVMAPVWRRERLLRDCDMGTKRPGRFIAA